MELAHTPLPPADADFQGVALCWLPQVSRYARLLTRDKSDADDLTQETFLKAFASWSTFRPGSDCRKWLFTICRNTFLRTRQRAKRVQTVEDPETEVYATALLYWDAVTQGLDDVFDRLDLGPALERALNAMLPEYAETVILVDIEDYTYTDAAATLGVPVGTVRSRLFRARRLLQEALMEYARDLGLGAARTPAAVEDITDADGRGI
jgi:RNA polymerase sigma-70 factor (ECF subfamily)